MWKKLAIAAGVLLLLLGLLVTTGVMQKSNSKKALAAYMEELQAQGEALTWKDLGYPPPAETNNSFSAFLTAVHKLGQSRPTPAELHHMHYIAPGTAMVAWATSRPLLSPSSGPRTSAVTWEQLLTDMDTASNTLAELRASLQNPPRYFPMNLTNPLAATPKNPFVEKRNAAQWLAADSLAALRENDLVRARADLHALTQLVQLHRDNPTLVNSMIRVAIAGLGLSTTWEALSAKGWTEQSLVALQHDWEAIDLIDALVIGMEGERVHVLSYFQDSQLASPPARLISMMGPGKGITALWDSVAGRIATTYWRNHIEDDQLLYLQLKQDRLNLLRQLKTNAPGLRVMSKIKSQEDELMSIAGGTFAKYRYALTVIAMPNYFRACQTVLKTETQRRMTIIAIALERYRRRNDQFPATLDELVPEFVSSVPIDPMSGQPFCYRTNADDSFTLYSLGEDGVDDGGDASSTNTRTSFDLWSGRDAVWPVAVTNASGSDHRTGTFDVQRSRLNVRC